MSDCVADSSDGKLFGMELRELGKSEQGNMDALIGHLPQLTHREHDIQVLFEGVREIGPNYYSYHGFQASIHHPRRSWRKGLKLAQE